jgi:hypothetical protein
MACQQFQGLWQRQSVERIRDVRSEQGVPANEGLRRIARPRSPGSLARYASGAGAIETTCIVNCD